MSDYGEDEAIAWQAEGEPDMVRVQRERAEKAEAEVERLKCCGNCGHMEQWEDDAPGCHYEICNIDFGGGVGESAVADPCRLSPSRWTPYWEGERTT